MGKLRKDKNTNYWELGGSVRQILMLVSIMLFLLLDVLSKNSFHMKMKMA